MTEPVELPFVVVSGVLPRNRALGDMHIGATWHIWIGQLNDCMQRLRVVGLSPGVAVWPVSNNFGWSGLLCALLLY